LRIQRKKLARRIKELTNHEASQRSIGTLLKADAKTIGADLREENSTGKNGSEGDSTVLGNVGGEFFPLEIDGARAARLVIKRDKRLRQDMKLEQQRIERRKTDSARYDTDIRCGDFREVLADLKDVDVIITDPPYTKEALPILADLAAWADRVLTTDGMLVVELGQMHLPKLCACWKVADPIVGWDQYSMGDGRLFYSPSRHVYSAWKPCGRLWKGSTV
jgi:hypothetical protein